MNSAMTRLMRSVSLVLLSAFAIAASAQQAGAPGFASDDNRFDGDHLQFRTNVSGFIPVDGADKSAKCAPIGSKLSVREELRDGNLLVRFYSVATDHDFPEGTKGAIDEACPPSQRVNTVTAYRIPKAALASFDFRRTGVSFGGLVVPFKIRLGGDRGITSSSTVAPYVGFRTAYFQSYGLSMTPIFSAGLGLVPVANPTTNTTETKNAFSYAFGLVMTSSKNDKLNSGVLVGRDRLGNADRALDPNVSKTWASFYVGLSL